MSRNVNRAAAARARKKGKRTSLILSLVAVAVVITLLALEQVALLYLLGTLGVAAILVIVAMADLKGAKAGPLQATPADDSAAVGDRTLKTTPVASYGASAPRQGARRRPRSR